MSNDRDDTGHGLSISVVEEIATVDIRERVTGHTRVSTRTVTDVEDVEVTLTSHGVEVVRVPVGRDLDPEELVPGIREEGGVTIMPVLEEILVVEKRLRLVEEVHVRRTTDAEDVRVPVTLRRQVAEVEHDDVTADTAADDLTKTQ